MERYDYDVVADDLTSLESFYFRSLRWYYLTAIEHDADELGWVTLRPVGVKGFQHALERKGSNLSKYFAFNFLDDGKISFTPSDLGIDYMR